MPALVVMLVELAAEDVEPGNPRQNGDQAGGAPPASLVLKLFCLPRRRSACSACRSPRCCASRFDFSFKRMPRLHRRLLGFEHAAALGVSPFQARRRDRPGPAPS